MTQVIGQALGIMLVLFALHLIKKYSKKLTNRLDKTEPKMSNVVKGFFVVLALSPWVGMFIYIKLYM